MLSRNISLSNFKLKKKNNNKKKVFKIFKKLLSSSNQVLSSLKSDYRDSYNKKFISKFERYNNFRLVGMGGSLLGAKAIYNFLSPKLKKFQFIDNFSIDNFKKNKIENITLVISK